MNESVQLRYAACVGVRWETSSFASHPECIADVLVVIQRHHVLRARPVVCVARIARRRGVLLLEYRRDSFGARTAQRGEHLAERRGKQRDECGITRGGKKRNF